MKIYSCARCWWPISIPDSFNLKFFRLSNIRLTFYKIQFSLILLICAFLQIGAASHVHGVTLPESNAIAVARATVTGTVTDAKGESLPGVSVRLKGTSVGATTDMEGRYTIQVPDDGGILVFSFVGFTPQEVSINGRSTINVKLSEEQTALDEVVVVGYGTQKKVNLTGAVASVTFDEKLSGRALSNTSSALNGLLPGLAVNQSSGMAGNNSATLLIRGLGTINNANPLVVVDGMPDVDINRLNLQDIENVSVLKDASSASIYGSRASNGVILITTKSGKGKKSSLTFNSHLAVQTPTNTLGFMADYPRALLIHRNAESVRTLPSSATYKYGTIEQWMALGMIDPLRYPNTDWFDLIIRDGVQQNYNLSASGGNEVSNFFISAGILDERGMQIGNDFKRYNARFNYDYKVRKNINTGIRFNGNWSDYKFAIDQGFTGDSKPGSGYDLRFAIAGLTPYDPVSGNYGGAMAYGEDPQAFNPYTVYMNEISKRNQKQANAVFFLDWEPLKGLKGRIDYSLNYGDQFNVKADIPNFAYDFQRDRPNGRVYIPNNAGIENTTYNNYKTMATAQLSYNTVIAKGHELSALAVYSEEYWNERSQYGFRRDRLHPSLSELDAALADFQEAKGNSSREGLRSYIGRLNYNAFNKYLLELNFRYDGSSKFLDGHQYGFFPSASFGWRFTEESFLNSLKELGLNSGKLRVSYGGLGNNFGVGRYEQRETLVANNYIIGDAIVRGFVNNKLINRNFTWEKTNVLNLGLDLVFMNNRLSAELDYYDRLTVDMAQGSDLSLHISGVYSPAPRKNIGEMRNRGVEGNFTWRDGSRDFQYSINLNASYNKNTLEKWNEYLVRGTTFLDMPYHFLYTFQDAGIAQTWQDVYNATPQNAAPGDILRQDLNGDGRIDDNDRKPYSNLQLDRPHTNFALNASFAYKGFDMNLQLQGAAGRKDYWLNMYNELQIGKRHATVWEHWNEAWSVENREGEWPRLNGSFENTAQTTFWLDDLSYLRIRNIQLGYNLPKSLLQKVKFNNVRLFISGENLHTFTSYRGIDPESTAKKNDIYPLAKSFSLGLNVNL